MSSATAGESERTPPGSGVVFCGLARNCAHALPRLLNVVASVGQSMGDWAYVFLESDSYDGTMAVLEAFHRRHGRGIVRSYGRLRERLPDRTTRLAYLRNQYLTLCESEGYFQRLPFCVVLDLDGVNEDLQSAALRARLTEAEPAWAALFANQSERYYDVWALRHPEWSPDDCWARVRDRPPGMTESEARRRFVEARQIRIPIDSDPIEVDSAFGGLGIYQSSWLSDAEYSGVGPDGRPTCEHVPLHASIRDRGGLLLIDPALVNSRGVQPHKAGFLRRVGAWLKVRSP